MTDDQAGYIDLHSHLVPGVDDGCRRTGDSLACIRRLQSAGFVGSVCTPHVWCELFPANTPHAIRGWVERLRDELLEAGIEYDLWPGGEVRIAPEIVDWFERHGVPTLGASRHVLVDYWGGDWPSFADAFIDWLLERDFQPILAHPERMGLENFELDRVTDSLLGRGVLLQGNLRSLAGGEGPRARQQLERLLERGQIFALATDTHSPADIDGRLAGIEALQRLLGPDAADVLLATRPREILALNRT